MRQSCVLLWWTSLDVLEGLAQQLIKDFIGVDLEQDRDLIIVIKLKLLFQLMTLDQ
jgi:hypothetical protein